MKIFLLQIKFIKISRKNKLNFKKKKIFKIKKINQKINKKFKIKINHQKTKIIKFKIQMEIKEKEK